MPERPTRIRILGKDYRVEWMRTLCSIGDLGGQCSNHDLLIRIDDCETFADAEQAETLLHEIMEAVKYQLGLDVPHSAVHALSTGLYAVLADNPILLSLLGKPG